MVSPLLPDATTINYVEVCMVSCFLVNKFFVKEDYLEVFTLFSLIFFYRIGHLYPLNLYIMIELQGIFTW